MANFFQLVWSGVLKFLRSLWNTVTNPLSWVYAISVTLMVVYIYPSQVAVVNDYFSGGSVGYLVLMALTIIVDTGMVTLTPVLDKKMLPNVICLILLCSFFFIVGALSGQWLIAVLALVSRLAFIALLRWFKTSGK